MNARSCQSRIRLLIETNNATRSIVLCGLLSDAALVPCTTESPGLRLWTGGRFLDSQKDYMWVLSSGKQLPLTSDFRKKLKKTDKQQHTCIDFWPREVDHWFSEPCDGKFCFLCENRNHIE